MEKRSLNPNHAWRPDRRFIQAHILIPLMGATLLLFAAETTGLDLWVANLWYELEGGSWAWRDSWFAYDIIHHRGKQAVIASGLTMMALLLLSCGVLSLRPWRRPLIYTLICIIVLPGILTKLKAISPAPCPWDVSLFGGDVLYRHATAYTLGAAGGGHCFPSGHASGGFAFFSVYFATMARTRMRLPWLLPGLVAGWIFALGQQARGAHFLSHDLWTMTFCWTGALLLFFSIKPFKSKP